MLIGIAGRARSGKDTIADHICKAHPDLQPYSFADPLKKCMNDWLGWGQEHGWGGLKEVTLPLSPDFYTLPIVIWEHFHQESPLLTRENCADACRTLEELMTEDDRFYESTIGGPAITLVSPREVYQWFGTNCMRVNVGPEFWLQIAPTTNTIIRDLRFENEADFIRDNGGTVVHVQRKGLVNGVPDHVSEHGIEIKEKDYLIKNDGSLEVLESRIDRVMPAINKG